jgi:hypoxanthine phosphoribosyltransferase
VSEIRTGEVTAASPTTEAARPPFAHESEVELARILDFYAVRWEYEPHTFPILWNLDGEVLESFSPDFYLPDLDLYVELTTLKQRLVRKKNRKLRRLRELYPGIRIKLFYGRDFRALMLKYGKLVLADALSGTPGQVVPARHRANPRPIAEEGPGRAVLGDDGDAVEGRRRRRERRGRRSSEQPAAGAVGPTPVAAGQAASPTKGARTQR